MKFYFYLAYWFVALLIVPSSADAKLYQYYSDQTNPPTTEREPWIEHTRIKIDKPYGYILVRYPYQNLRKSEAGQSCVPYWFKFTIGNESEKDFHFFIQKVGLKNKNGKTIPLKFVHFDGKMSDIDAIKKIPIVAKPSVYGTADFYSDSCNLFEKQSITLKIEGYVVVKKKKENFSHTFDIYPGIFEVS